MMGERPPLDPLPFGFNVYSVGSSTGWTDKKHMRYITSLEESFVNQLYNGEIDSNGLSCQSPEIWHKTSYNGNGSKTIINQGYWGMLETDGPESRSSQIEYLGSPSCSGFQENSIACYMDYDTSTNCPQQERTSNPARLKNSGRFAASYLRWHGHSLPRRTASTVLYQRKQPLSFIRVIGSELFDGETEGTDEHSRRCREKRQKQKAGSASSSRGHGPKRWSM